MQYAHIALYMTLDDYLNSNAITGPEFASRIGVHPATVYRIRHGMVMPHRNTIRAIIRETGQQVTIEELIAPNNQLERGSKS